MVTARKTPAAARNRVAPAPGAAKPAPLALTEGAAPPDAGAKLAKAGKTAKPVKAEKAEKAKKPKAVRDSFTMPKAEYAVIDALKTRAAKAGAPAKKSELLRAGIKALAAMNEAAFLAAVKAVPAIKTGRPTKA